MHSGTSAYSEAWSFGGAHDWNSGVRRTASRAGVAELRTLFRHLEELRSLYEAEGVDEVETPQGNRWSLWDLEYLYEESQKQPNLTLRQSQAITLCLVHGLSEKEASRIIGTKDTNPVAIYANQGLARLIDLIEAGKLQRFRPVVDPDQSRQQQRYEALLRISSQIKASVTVEGTGCWVYPLSHPRVDPAIALRASTTPRGYLLVHPLHIMFEALIAPVPPGHRVTHDERFQYYYRGCANPEHAILLNGSGHEVEVWSSWASRAGSGRDAAPITA